jgi:hypothetical protein
MPARYVGTRASFSSLPRKNTVGFAISGSPGFTPAQKRR